MHSFRQRQGLWATHQRADDQGRRCIAVLLVVFSGSNNVPLLVWRAAAFHSRHGYEILTKIASSRVNKEALSIWGSDLHVGKCPGCGVIPLVRLRCSCWVQPTTRSRDWDRFGRVHTGDSAITAPIPITGCGSSCGTCRRKGHATRDIWKLDAKVNAGGGICCRPGGNGSGALGACRARAALTIAIAIAISAVLVVAAANCTTSVPESKRLARITVVAAGNIHNVSLDCETLPSSILGLKRKRPGRAIERKYLTVGDLAAWGVEVSILDRTRGWYLREKSFWFRATYLHQRGRRKKRAGLDFRQLSGHRS